MNKAIITLYETFVMLYGFTKAKVPNAMRDSGMDETCLQVIADFNALLTEAEKK